MDSPGGTVELNHAELYGIDLKKLKQESFLHLGHHRMLKEHYNRVKAWEHYRDVMARHTEEDVPAPTSSSIITTTEKNGN